VVWIIRLWSSGFDLHLPLRLGLQLPKRMRASTNEGKSSVMDKKAFSGWVSAAAALACLSLGSTAFAAPSISVDPAVLDGYVGYYQFGPAVVMHVTREGPQLITQLTGQGQVKIDPQSATEFILPPINAHLTFMTDAQGHATELVLRVQGQEVHAARIADSLAQQLSSQLAARVQAQTPNPGSEAALRELVTGLMSGAPNYDAMTPQFAAVTRQQLSALRAALNQWGPVQSIQFRSVNNQGMDAYEVTHEHGVSEWQIGLTADGKVSGAGVQPKVSNDPALPPVDASAMQAVLTKDLEQALKSGALAPNTSAGVTIGVIREGVQRVFAFGTAKPDSIFEIGSITKTFTGLVLAQMIAQGKVTLDEPVRELLPPGTVAKPAGAEISLLDLVTQHSGLPRMPDNFQPANLNNPYADYHAADLYRFIAKYGVQKRADATFLYSNLGVGLLGQALANRAGMSYSRLLEQQVIAPLGLHDTVISLSPAQQSRFIQGHTATHTPAHSWEIDALAGAGAIRSTAADMLIYLNANLHPDQLPATTAGKSARRTLAASIVQSHELRADSEPGMRIAFAWLFVPASATYWHNGGTGGYSSYAFFSPQHDYAAIVLMNTGPGAGSFADRLGQHIEQRLAGLPAISLSN
jgi:CubicO group peptidase (beta-lactamase class C family)